VNRAAAVRLNALKSTGRRAADGKPALRTNALKSGIDAKLQIVRREESAAAPPQKPDITTASGFVSQTSPEITWKPPSPSDSAVSSRKRYGIVRNAGSPQATLAICRSSPKS